MRNSRSRIVKCNHCGKELKMPNLLSEKKRKEILSPFCCAGTVFTVQWLIHHGWHCTSYEANPPGEFLCPDCFKEGMPEFHKSKYGEQWCEQAKKWMEEEQQ